jgi:alpha-L-rhamnosidase
MPRNSRRSLVAVLVTTLVLAVVGVPPAASAAPPGLAGAHWIWFPEGDPRVSAPEGHRFFRATFTVAAGAVSDATFTVTADDTVDVWLNGTPLAGSARLEHTWRQSIAVDLRPALRAGANTIAVAARNTSASPAGLVGRLRVATAGGVTDLVTGAGWQSTRTAPADWEQGTWTGAQDLGAYGIAPWNQDVVAPDVSAVSPLRVTQGTVEHRAEPLGVDAAKPRFGWQLGTSAPQQRQAAYQLTVSGPGGVVWDSGRVVSGTRADVTYGGPALAPLTRHTWRVRVWDTQGRTGDWSPDYGFETAPAGWTARFIGQRPSAPALTGASWIWFPEGDPVAGVPPATRYFRRTVQVAAAGRATLVITGDDTADVWVNGTQVSTSARVTDSWKNAAVADVPLTAGANVIAVRAENTAPSGSASSPAGLIAALAVQGGQTVVTDGAWKASQTGPSGWQGTGFNDGAWPSARALTAYGTGPWGANVRVSQPAPLLRKGFTVSKPVARARLMTTALGLHETRLNGTRVGADVLAPGWTDYRKRLQYKVFDVTGQVRQGANALGAWLGNGWYSGSLGFAGNQYYGTQPWYSAQLVITHTDGTTSVVGTDDTWRTAASPIRADDLYHGETYDARLAVSGWDSPGFDDGAWAAPVVRTEAAPAMVSQVDNGVTVQQEFRPIAVTQPKPGVWVFDLGQNFTGWNRLAVRGPAGTTVTMRHAEVLNPDGTIYTTNLRAAQVTDRYTLAGTGAVETWEPRFTVHGYRYVELTGLPSAPTADMVTGRAAWASGGQPGTLTTSNALVNQLQHNILWGTRSNMLSIPTDCPQRDERLGWTGDIAIFAGTSTFNLGAHNFLSKFADDLVDAQQSDGAFTDVAPAVISGGGHAGWADAGVIVPYTLWQRYGDTTVIDEHFAAMTKFVDYLRATSGANLIRDQWTFGDWLNVNDNTAQDLLSTAFFSWSARLVSRMAAATGRTAEATTYGRLADDVAAAFTTRFARADGTIGSNTQTGYVLALAFGLLPQSLRQPAADRLAAKVASTGGHLSVGFLGVENLLPVLAENGHVDTAYQILLQPDFPGWGYMQSRGATTIWERWDGIRPDGSFNDPGMNSFNHYGMGSVGDFLYRQVAGLGPASAGYGSLLIAPKPGGGLTSANATYDTPYGTAKSDWSTSGGRLTLRVTIPTGTWATVRVPGTVSSYPPEAVPTEGGFYVPSGSYTFTAG